MSVNSKYPVLYNTKDQCCGCSACADICKQHAIVMKEDEEGFLYPSIDESRCVFCKSCILVCPFKCLKDSAEEHFDV